MNRERKIKVWYADEKRMAGPFTPNEWCNRLPSNVEQVGVILDFTGLKEGGIEEGQDLYFGDLMQAPSGNVFEVIWYEEEMRIALRHKDTIYNFNVPLYKKIGTIYENPDLLATEGEKA